MIGSSCHEWPRFGTRADAVRRMGVNTHRTVTWPGLRLGCASSLACVECAAINRYHRWNAGGQTKAPVIVIFAIDICIVVVIALPGLGQGSSARRSRRRRAKGLPSSAQGPLCGGEATRRQVCIQEASTRRGRAAKPSAA
jgi:hypothetical protein